MLPNYYQILGVSSTATVDEIRQAYRLMAFKCHPDRGGSHERMLQINEAFQILSDTERRRAYDFSCSHPANTTALQKVEVDQAQARERAKDYPRDWSAFDQWLNAITSDVTNAEYGKTRPVAYGAQLPSIKNSWSGIVFLIFGGFAGLIIGIILSESGCVSSGTTPQALFGCTVMFAWVGYGLHKLLGKAVKAVVPTSGQKASHEIISCPHCKQSVRLPRLGKRLKVTCPSCAASFFHN